MIAATALLDEDQIRRCIDRPKLIAQLRDAFGSDLWARGQVPRRTVVTQTEPFGAFGAMPAYSAASRLFVTKVAAFVATSDHLSSPAVHAVVVAMSTQTGEVLAILDGAEITRQKSAAITAVVTDLCTPQRRLRFGLVGTGQQARAQFAGVSAVRELDEVRVYSRNPANVRRLVAELRVLLSGGTVVAADSIEDAVAGADVVSTATTSWQPLVDPATLPEHVHVNCVGAHTTDSREVAHSALAGTTVIVEDRETAVQEAGAIHDRALDLTDLVTCADDTLRERRTVFSSTGHASIDLVTTEHVLRSRDILHAPPTDAGEGR